MPFLSKEFILNRIDNWNMGSPHLPRFITWYQASGYCMRSGRDIFNGYQNTANASKADLIPLPLNQFILFYGSVWFHISYDESPCSPGASFCNPLQQSVGQPQFPQMVNCQYWMPKQHPGSRVFHDLTHLLFMLNAEAICLADTTCRLRAIRTLAE